MKYRVYAYSDTFVRQVIRTERGWKQVLNRFLHVRTITFSQEHAPVCSKLQRQKEHLQDT